MICGNRKKGKSSFQSPECESKIAPHQTRGEKIKRFKWSSGLWQHRTITGVRPLKPCPLQVQRSCHSSQGTCQASWETLSPGRQSNTPKNCSGFVQAHLSVLDTGVHSGRILTVSDDGGCSLCLQEAQMDGE